MSSCARHPKPEPTTNDAQSASARDNRAHNIQGHGVAICQGAPDVKKTGHHHTPKVHGVRVDTREGSNPSPLATSSIQFHTTCGKSHNNRCKPSKVRALSKAGTRRFASFDRTAAGLSLSWSCTVIQSRGMNHGTDERSSRTRDGTHEQRKNG